LVIGSNGDLFVSTKQKIFKISSNGTIKGYTSNTPTQLPKKTFGNSNYLKIYSEYKVPPEFQHEVFTALRDIVSKYCTRHGIDANQGDEFFRKHQQEAFKKLDLLLDNVPAACMTIWTSTLKLNNRELCSILNESIRLDDSDSMHSVVKLVRGIDLLCVGTRDDVEKFAWPTNNKLYRGASLPTEKKEFFKEGRKYRCPMYLATTMKKSVSKQFCKRASNSGFPPVLYVIHLHPQYHSYNVSYVNHTNVISECEFLFTPYSVFTVQSVEWQQNPTWMIPHVIHLESAVDNKVESKDIPLSTWH